MNILEQENKLFDEWKEKRQNRPGFVRDGIVSEEDYVKSNPRLTIILKEMNNPGGGDSSLIEQLKDGVGYKIWHNVARWVYGIRNMNSLPNWENFCEEVKDTECRKHLFQSISVINLKKSPGGSASNKTLQAVAREDKKYIQEQYKIYDPDITLCGGTGDLFKEVMEHTDESQEWKQTKRGAWWYERETGKYVLYLYHPAVPAVVRNALLFYEMFDTVEEIYK